MNNNKLHTGGYPPAAARGGGWFGGIPLSNKQMKFFKNYVENFFIKIYK